MRLDFFSQVSVVLVAIGFSFTALYFGSDLFGPIFLAFVTGVILAPFVDRLERIGLGRAIGALLILTLALASIIVGGILIEPVITSAVRQMPVVWYELQGVLAFLKSTFRGLGEVSNQVAEALSDDPSGATAGKSKEVGALTATDALSYASDYTARAFIFAGTLFFFLLSRLDVYQWIGRVDMTLNSQMMLDAERRVSRYFSTITIINACFGGLIMTILWVFGMPYAPLWGLVAFLANFVLYLGPAVFAVALLFGGIATFDGAFSFAPAALYLALNATEGSLVTPSLVGRHMSINPLMVFLSLVFWIWMWGPLGGIVAIPLLVWVMSLAEAAGAD